MTKTTGNDFTKTVQEVSKNISYSVDHLPQEVRQIGLIAVGAALGTKFPNATLFLGAIYVLSKILK